MSKEASRKLPFPSLLTPTTKTSVPLFYFIFSFFISQNQIFSLLPRSFLFTFYFLIFFFVIALKHLFLSSLMAAASSPRAKKAASSPWQWWQRFRFEFGFGLMGFLLKVWFWVLSCWVFHWRFDFGFGLILVWFFFVFGWYCDWNIMGCDRLWWWWLSGG